VSSVTLKIPVREVDVRVLYSSAYGKIPIFEGRWSLLLERDLNSAGVSLSSRPSIFNMFFASRRKLEH